MRVINCHPCHIGILIRIGMQDSAEEQHLPFGAGGIHLRLEGIPIGLGNDRIRCAMNDQDCALDVTLPGRPLRLEIAVDRYDGLDVGAIAREIERVAAAEAEADRRAMSVDEPPLLAQAVS